MRDSNFGESGKVGSVLIDVDGSGFVRYSFEGRSSLILRSDRCGLSLNWTPLRMLFLMSSCR